MYKWKKKNSTTNIYIKLLKDTNTTYQKILSVICEEVMKRLLRGCQHGHLKKQQTKTTKKKEEILTLWTNQFIVKQAVTHVMWPHLFNIHGLFLAFDLF